jgi:LAS superfamily LD-carboxypeptidase LdcB
MIYSQSDKLSFSELMGKGDPVLYGNGHSLRKLAHEAFLDMKTTAEKDNISIHAVSSYRSFVRQKEIWERKYLRNIELGFSPIESIKMIIKYSTIPGTSRHHWGTDIDIVDGNFLDTPALLSAKNFKKGQPFYNLGVWLKQNAKSFGYYLVYTDDPGRKGFEHEPWHFSFKPLSTSYLKQYQELNIIDVLRTEKIKGSEHFSESFLNSYFNEHVMDINPELIL